MRTAHQSASIPLLSFLTIAMSPLGAQIPPTWNPTVGSGPSPRSSTAIAHDSLRGRTVLFGGTTNGAHDGATWEWDGTAWLPQLFASGPSPRATHAMAYDSLRARTVMFGGTNTGGLLADTWEWNGAVWAQVASLGPSARSGHAMAYDSSRGRIVLYGGFAWNGGWPWPPSLGDTWEWNGATWAQVASSGPPGRYLAGMVYDSLRGQTVLFGGNMLSSFGNNPVGDTWEWDGAGWTQVAVSGPAPRFGCSMAFDDRRGRSVLFGGYSTTHHGDTWEWDGTHWAQVSSVGPQSRSSAAMAYDTHRHKSVLFGGQVLSGNLGDTWEWAGYHTSTASTFGAGCGNPPLTLSPQAAGRPTINTTAQVSIHNVPSNLAFVAIGWSNSAFGLFPLPLTLAGYGMPGCELLQSSEFNVPAAITGPGTAAFSLPLPNWYGLIGLHLFLQGWAVAPGVNPGNTIVSNGVEWAIGNS